MSGRIRMGHPPSAPTARLLPARYGAGDGAAADPGGERRLPARARRARQPQAAAPPAALRGAERRRDRPGARRRLALRLAVDAARETALVLGTGGARAC